MQLKTTIIVLVSLAVVAVLAAAALPASSVDAKPKTGTPAAGLSGLAAMAMPKAVMFTVEAGTVTEGNLTYSIPYAARVQSVGDKDIAIVATYNKPLAKTVNIPAGTGIISTDDALPATATIDFVNRSAIPVAGANAVVVLRQFDITGTSMDSNAIDFQVGSINVYLPDGSVKAMKLDRPVQISLSLDTMKAKVIASPALASKVADLFVSGNTFPTNAAPVRLNDILAAM